MLSAAMGAIKYFSKISLLSFLFLSQFATQEVRDNAIKRVMYLYIILINSARVDGTVL